MSTANPATRRLALCLCREYAQTSEAQLEFDFGCHPKFNNIGRQHGLRPMPTEN